MTFKENFVVAVKHDGEILREVDNCVFLPFKSEYSILLKNLSSRKASVKVQIDGQDVLYGKALIIDPNSTTELERFVDQLDMGNRFRFIQKTKEISDYRGDRIDDGIIRVEFAFERAQPIIWNFTYYQASPLYYSKPYYPKYPEVVWACAPCSDTDSSCLRSASSDATVRSCSFQSQPLEDGITVKGSESKQGFSYGHIGELEPAEVITLKLCGRKDSGLRVAKPITVHVKKRCTTCGREAPYVDKFCSNCSTALE